MSPQDTPISDPRDLRPKGRPTDHKRVAQHYSSLLAQARAVHATAVHYAGLLAELEAELRSQIAADVPCCAADFRDRADRRIPDCPF